MKQRDLLKVTALLSRVKRLLKEQKDMGQVSEAAVVACSSAVQVFVRDLATKMQRQAVEGVGLTPVELKKSVLACGELNFLHNKVTAIDESDIKYRKPARGGKKRILKAAAKDSTTTKKARTTKTKKAASATATGLEKTTKLAGNSGDDGNDNVTVTEKAASLITKARALEVEEDDDYDESDSDA
ncbi:hypothetical protein F443_20256 [Phytophthora nicotianae P1569]|uniref:Transcription factor CBF/NF-Y/archaeal histone domain-containing protein n=3 Tax=Phytophthora nicotianae TaxID=4792 RepID=V9E3Z5_PHYNI|nr:hypothetical protein F443_20256 [Phytophthora nicotianae P1569]